MKLQIESVVSGLLIGMFIGIGLTLSLAEESRKQNIIHEAEDRGPILIWNDDDEGLPAIGQLVELEMVKNDTIYVCNKTK